MKLITISGVDGSGKSTQVKMLKEYLESQGKRVYYFHAIEFGIAKKINEFKNKYCLICRSTGKCQKEYKEKSVTKANFFQIVLRRFFLPIDVLRFRILSRKLRNNGFEYILSDRYFYDSLINIEYLLRHRMSKCGLLSKPDVAFFLDADPEIIMQRERKPDQGIDYLKTKQKLFRDKIETWGLKCVDGNRNKEAVFEEIKKVAY